MSNGEYSDEFNRDPWDLTEDEGSLDPFIEQFWTHVVDYAAELGVSVKYVEEEFVIDGELIRHTEN
jgi:hypothetical protein